MYLYGLSLSKVSIVQTRFEGNMGTHGTICISTAVVDFIGNTTFTTNSARGNGGAIYVKNTIGEVRTINACTFEKNSAVQGGALYSHEGTFKSISNSVFEENRAPDGGPDIWAQGCTSTTVIINSDFREAGIEPRAGGFPPKRCADAAVDLPICARDQVCADITVGVECYKPCPLGQYGGGEKMSTMRKRKVRQKHELFSKRSV